MSGGPPPECQPINEYRWVGSNSLIMRIILDALPWFNWKDSRQIIRREILANTDVQYAFAQTGFWIKYFVENQPNSTHKLFFKRF